MNKLDRLVQSYDRHIAVPWQSELAPDQRVIFCVYNEADELRLRAKIDEFEIATKNAQHDWALFNLTDTFAHWMSSQKYATSYFEQPDLLPAVLATFLTFIAKEFQSFLAQNNPGTNAVVAVIGVGSLFGFLKIKSIVDQLAPTVAGRLLIFFPGSHEDNNYRLLNGYDGWNYHAVAITADNNF